MSRERARRREARLAESRAREIAAEQRAARRARRRGAVAAVRRTLTPWRRGRVGRVGTRRAATQRAVIVMATVLVAFAAWVLIDSWPLRIAVGVLILVAGPALVTLTFDRARS